MKITFSKIAILVVMSVCIFYSSRKTGHLEVVRTSEISLVQQIGMIGALLAVISFGLAKFLFTKKQEKPKTDRVFITWIASLMFSIVLLFVIGLVLFPFRGIAAFGLFYPVFPFLLSLVFYPFVKKRLR